MRQLKRLVACSLIAVMMLSLVACGGNKGGTLDSSSTESSESTNSVVSNESEKEITKVVYAYLSFNTIPEDLSKVEEAINQITRDKIGVEVELMPLAISNYTQQINLAMQGGEQIDVFHTLGDFPQYLSKNQAYDITDIIDTCASEAKEIVGERFLSTTTKDSKVYGIPANKAIAWQPQFIYREDIMQEIGVDPTTISSIEDLREVFAKVKEKYPDMTLLASSGTGDVGMGNTMKEMDFLSDDMYTPKGVLEGDNTTVVDYYSTDQFKEKITLMREWYNKGYISKDAATTTSTQTELISSGKAFAYIASYSYPPEDTAIAIEAQMGTSGYQLGAVNIGDAYLDTSSVNAITWMVASTSKNPEAALKFLNLTYSDEQVLNLIIYGIEGEDYVTVSDNVVKYPDGLDATTVPYTAQLSCGIVGNQFKQFIMEGTNPDSAAKELDMNLNAKSSKAFGFMFDNEKVKNEYTSVINVINQYLPGLRCGSLDPETELPKFIDKLKEAGMDKIIAEKQSQLDAWLVE